MRSDRKIASSIECVINTIVVGADSQISSTRRFISSRVKESSAPKGSSISRTEGLNDSARTRAARCCIPPDNSRGKRPPNPSRPTRVQEVRRSKRDRAFSPLISNGKCMLASTSRQGSRFASWNTIPICGWVRAPVDRREEHLPPSNDAGRTSTIEEWSFRNPMGRRSKRSPQRRYRVNICQWRARSPERVL